MPKNQPFSRYFSMVSETPHMSVARARSQHLRLSSPLKNILKTAGYRVLGMVLFNFWVNFITENLILANLDKYLKKCYGT